MQAASVENSLIGQTLDNKFLVLRLIGRGGMGEVFEAEHTTLGKRVAIKLMLEKYNGDGEAITRFTREAQAASRIGNPHIIDVLDIGVAPDGRAFVVMELLQGMPLSELIELHGTLPQPRALAIMRQVLRAVGAAHAKGIVHRDLKPDNIFLVNQSDHPDYVKLLDFGISKLIDPDLEAAATKLTTTGVVIGTPLYMAPEQAMGEDINHLADIYACGVILYEMLAGKPPFEGATYAALVARVLTTDAPLLSALRPELSPKLVAAVHRALDKTPSLRHASADEFVAALPTQSSASAMELGATVAADGATTMNTTAARPRRTRWIVAAALASVVVGGVVTMVVTRDPGPDPTPPVPVIVEHSGSASPGDQPDGRGSGVTVEAIAQGVLKVDSEPAGAIVIFDGVSRGRTPTVISNPPGRYKLRLELDGYVALETDEEIVAGGDRGIRPSLKPIAKPIVKIVKSPGRERPPIRSATAPVKPETSPPVKTVPHNPPPPPPPVKTDVKRPPAPPVGPGTKPNPYD